MVWIKKEGTKMRFESLVLDFADAFRQIPLGQLERRYVDDETITLAAYLGADGMLHARPTRARRAYRPSCVTLRGISSHPAAGHDGEHFAHEVKRRFAEDGWVFVP